MSDSTPARRFDPTDGPWPLSIAAMLDDVHHQQALFLQRAWAKVLPDSEPARLVPHLSLHSAMAYLDAAEEAVAAIAADQAPLSLRCGGLGFFTASARPVVYVPAVRDDALSALHARLWEALAPLSREPLGWCAPARWLPHITLAHGPLDPDRLAALLAVPAARGPQWDATLHGIALVAGGPDGDRVVWQHPLVG